MNEIILKVPLVKDNYTEVACRMYDVPPSEESITIVKDNIELPKEDWNIGLIFGASGCGKSTLLKKFGNVYNHHWDNRPIISNFGNISPEDATKVLCSVGLSSVPSWLRPYHCLSNGEKFRADLGQAIVNSKEVTLIDEFTSVVDRNVAKSASYSLQKYMRRAKKKVIVASCHSDIIEWLNPDWVYNPTEGVTHYPRGLLQRPKISLKIFRSKYEAWDLFKQHHYLTASLNKASRLFLASWEDRIVGCIAILPFPNKFLKNAWRASRTVILPDYQGLGLGIYLSDYFGSLIKAREGRFYSRTVHPAMISHRLRSGLWKETSRSRTTQSEYDQSCNTMWKVDAKRECYSFEYIGEASSYEDSRLFWETTT